MCPVLGVVPYLDVDIDDEDTLSGGLARTGAAAGLIDIAVIRLPRISNFTDFSALEQVAGRWPALCAPGQGTGRSRTW